MKTAPAKPRGLGDLVAIVAEPIARFSDAHLGTHLVGCQPCTQRRADLNTAVPDVAKALRRLVPDITKPTG